MHIYMMHYELQFTQFGMNKIRSRKSRVITLISANYCNNDPAGYWLHLGQGLIISAKLHNWLICIGMYQAVL